LVLLVSVCSAAILSDSDLSRANQVKPRDHLSGADFVSMTTNLNSHLHHVTDQQSKACAEFSDDELKTLAYSDDQQTCKPSTKLSIQF